ncbi:MAG: thioredoxin family protein [Promethearchaeota archaeon]
MVKEVNESELKEIIKNNPLVLVDYFTTWCGPCKIQHRILEELEKIVNAVIVSIDIDKNEKVAVELGIQAIPTLQFFKNGELFKFKKDDKYIDRFVGIRNLEILENIIKKIENVET